MIKKFMPKSSFARGFSMLVGGTAAAQFVVILSSPFLTRLYTPDDFGLLAVYASVLALFTVVASLRYQLAIPLPNSNDEAIHIVILSILLTFLTTLISTILVVVWGGEFLVLLNTPQLQPYLWLIPIGVFFSGLYQAFNYWSIRTKEFKVLAKTSVLQKVASAVVQLCGFKLGAISLIVGQAVGQSAGISSLANSALKQKSFWCWKWSDLWKQAVRYKYFPFFSTWSGFANTLGSQLPTVLFASLFSTSVAGFYMLAHRILSLPMTLVGKAIGDVFLSHAVEAQRNNNLKPLFEMVAGRLIMFAMPIVLVLVIDAPTMFSILFGEEWREAGVYGQWMGVWLGLVLVCSPLSVIFEVLEKQIQGMIFQVCMTFSRISALFVGVYIGDAVTTIILFSIVGVVFWFGFLCWAAIQSKSSISFIISKFLKSTLWAFLLSFPFLLGSHFSNSIYFWWGSALLTSSLVFGYYFYQLKCVKNEC